MSEVVLRLDCPDGKRRLEVRRSSIKTYTWEELTEQPDDEYTGPYFLPTYGSGHFSSAEEEAERDARLTLPRLRND